jgi:quercetin dioxygenase-like cupin family protein
MNSRCRGPRLRPLFLCPLTAVLLTPPALGQEARPLPVLPDTVPYVAVSQVPGVETKWLVGAASSSGLYLFRNRFAPGTKLQPHTHPDTRFTYVLSGTLYAGFGPVFDSTKTVAIPMGAVYVAPAGVPHYAWARDGEVIFQETGVGPTATAFIDRRPR